MKVLNVAGARPNFVKIAPILRAMQRHPQLEPILVHTDQHYSPELSRSFFEELAIPAPDFNLGAGSGSHAQQTARIMLAFEPVLLQCQPDLVLLVGDVNSTLACALVAAKRGVRVAHVEAGLRSFDRSMPEELNRILTDQLADVLFTPSIEAGENLRREGIEQERIQFVGNVMIDSLRRHLDEAVARSVWRRWSLQPKQYAVLTLHRPSNVDDRETLLRIIRTMVLLQERVPIVFPVHPRTGPSIRGLTERGECSTPSNLHITDPLGYLDFMSLVSRSALVLTDSGGVQEECTYLGVPCLTLRSHTERPVTVTEGTNVVVGLDRDRILREAGAILEGRFKQGRIPAFWDGETAPRIVDVLLRGETGVVSPLKVATAP